MTLVIRTIANLKGDAYLVEADSISSLLSKSIGGFIQADDETWINVNQIVSISTEGILQSKIDSKGNVVY